MSALTGVDVTCHAVLTHCPNWTLNNLPKEYISLAQFQLDPDLMETVQQTVRASDVMAEQVQGQPDDTDHQQQWQDMQSGNERRSTTAPEVPVPPATGVQKKVGLHLSQLASLSYKVSNIDCLKRVVDALTALQHDMRTNAAYDSAFLEPVSRRHRFVSANSALHRRLAALRKRHQRRRHRRQQRSVNID